MDCPGRPAELEKEELPLVRIRGIRAAGAYIVVPRLQESEAPYGQSAYHAANHFGVLQSQFGDWWGAGAAMDRIHNNSGAKIFTG